MGFRTTVTWACLLVLPATTRAQESPKVHELKATQATVHHNFFDASLRPVLTIESGDIVRLETATGNPRWFENLGVPKEKIPAELYPIFDSIPADDRGDHTLNGPIAIRGAEPGDVLEIRIRDPRPTLQVVEAVLAMTWRVLLAPEAELVIGSNNPVFFRGAYGIGTANGTGGAAAGLDESVD